MLETPVTNLDQNHTTSAHPDWRDVLWLVIHAGEWLEPLDKSALQHVTDGFLKLKEPLKALGHGGGAYVNEALHGATLATSIFRRLLRQTRKHQ